MTKNLILDAQLSKDSYANNNNHDGSINGWNRITLKSYELPANSNFAAQLYKDADGSYKIAYRGTENLTGAGDLEINKGILNGQWTPEMTESAKFTYYAIKQIQLSEPDLTFKQAAGKLEVTGHSQGGFEAEFNAQLFGLNGTSIDGPGAGRVKNTEGWSEIKAWIQSQEPEAKLDSGIGDFVARQYTNVVGGINGHFPGVEKDKSAILLMQNATAFTLLEQARNLSTQAMLLHSIDYIISAEESKDVIIKIMDKLKSSVDELIGSLQKDFGKAKITISPLILDLDGDGIETISKSDGIHFDHDGNLFAETTGWVGKDDALLVLDRNSNGIIDSGAELFGNNTVLKNGMRANNGFSALSELDSNLDGKINAADALFSQLRLWKDNDSDAQVDEGELLTLEQAKVGSLNVDYTSQNLTDTKGNQLLQKGSYTNLDGSSCAMVDVWFGADLARTKDMHIANVSDDITALPDLPGFGKVQSLHLAMANDSSGKLQGLVRELIAETDTGRQKLLMEKMLFAWTGVAGYGVNSRGGYFGDGRKLYALESFLGEQFLQSDGINAGTIDPGPEASKSLRAAYDNLFNHFYCEIKKQGIFRPLYESIGLVLDTKNSQVKIDVTSTVLMLKSACEADPASTVSLMAEFAECLKTDAELGRQAIILLNEQGNIYGSQFARALATLGKFILQGDNNNNSITGKQLEENILSGKAGDDFLLGGEKNDFIDGGADNDVMDGGYGSDTYLITGVGSGVDRIKESSSSATDVDKVQFDLLASTELTALERRKDDLILKYGMSDQLIIQNYFYKSNFRIEQFVFSDGVRWIDADIKARVLTMGTNVKDTLSGYDDGSNHMLGLEGDDALFGGAKGDQLEGGSGNDSLNGNNGDDVLLGGDGNDTLSGGEGNDVLDGELGNDVMVGGMGSDTYLIKGLGSGMDSISENNSNFNDVDKVLFSSIASTDLTALERRGDDLIFKYGTSDQLTVSYYFRGSTNQIEKFEFSDGVKWSDTDIKSRVMTVGTSGKDTIYGYIDGSNRISGFDGDDSLYGGTLNDRIEGGAGNDNLTGGDGDDVLDGGSGDDVVDGGRGSDTYVFKDRGVDKIVDFNYTYVPNEVDRVQFELVASTDVMAVERRGYDLILKYGITDQLTVSGYFYSSSYRIEQFYFNDGVRWSDAEIKLKVMTYGTTGKDFLYGYDDGSNRIWGFDGDDSLTGGAKDDYIEGGSGSDSLIGYSGNDVLLGGEGNDLLNGGYGNDFLDAGAGDDSLIGGDGDDILNAGIGNDILDGGSGSDIYILKDRGMDAIVDYNYAYVTNEVDRVQFELVASTDVVALERRGYALILKYGISDQLTIQNYFYSWNYRIEQFVFNDGVRWGDADIKAQVMTYGTTGKDFLNGYDDGPNRIWGFDGDDSLTGGAKDDRLEGGIGNDVLNGNNGNDELLGGEGNDILYGGDGDDVLDGGIGDDFIYGGDGADRIRFGKGYGNDSFLSVNNLNFQTDTIELFDIRSDEITLTRVGDVLMLKVNGTNDTLSIGSYFASGTFSTVRELRFADNTSWYEAEIKSRVITIGDAGNNTITGYNNGSNRIYGLEGADTLYGGLQSDLLDGGEGNDWLEGGDGNDTLIGGAGNDTLYGGEGDDLLDGGFGDDIIYCGNGADRIRFGKGYGNDNLFSSSTVIFKTTSLDLFDIKSDEVSLTRVGDTLMLKVNGKNDTFAIGSYFSNGMLTTMIELRFADNISWYERDIKARVLTMGDASNNTITGYSNGSNRIYGLAGADTLYGGVQYDLIDGGDDNDWLEGGNGNDVLLGGTGNDVLNGGAGADLLVGGVGNDDIYTGLGADIVAFNSGDGQDRIFSVGGKDKTLSLGGGISEKDLYFSKKGNDLLLSISPTDQVTFKDWYTGADKQTFKKLQIVSQAVAVDPTLAEPLPNRAVVREYDFETSFRNFEMAINASPDQPSWSLLDAIQNSFIKSSNTASIGGDLTHRYGSGADLSGSAATSLMGTVSGSDFGIARTSLLAPPFTANLSMSPK